MSLKQHSNIRHGHVHRNLHSILLLASLLLLATIPVSAQEPLRKSFTMQGVLEFTNQMVVGPVDFIFTAYDGSDPVTASLLDTFSQDEVDTTQGFFNVEIEFSTEIFTGNQVWIQTSVRRPGEGIFTDLLPLQNLTPTPYAIHALGAERAEEAGFAEDADRLDGLDSNKFLKTSGGTVQGSLDVTGDVESSTFTLGGTTIDSWSDLSPGGGNGDNLGNHIAEWDLQMSNHSINFDIGYGLRAAGSPCTAMDENCGAQFKTGPNGWTFQFWPGHPDAHSAIFRKYDGNQEVVIDKNGRLGIGVFEPQRRLHVVGSAIITGNIEVGGQCFRPRTLIRCYFQTTANHMTWVDNESECVGAGGHVGRNNIMVLASC